MKQLVAEKDARMDDFKSQMTSLSSQNKMRAEDDHENFNNQDQRRFFKYSNINSYPKERHSEEKHINYKTPIKQNNDSYDEFQMDPISHSVNYQYQSQNQKDDFIMEYNNDYNKDHNKEILTKDYNINKRSPIKMFQEQRKSPFVDKSSNISNNNVMDLMKSTTSIPYKAQEIMENYSELEETEKINATSKYQRKYYKNVDDRNNIPVPYDDFMNKRQKKTLKENDQEKINEDILNILMQLNKEKSFIEEKLAELEKRLSESENVNENLQYEKEKLKSELVKIYQEVKIAKSDLALIEEKESPFKNSNQKQQNINKSVNNDKEATLKTEIKFLINKLLKAKGKLVKEKDDLSFKDSGQKNKNYNSTSSNYEVKRSSDQKKKMNYSLAVAENREQPQRARTPILYKESRSKDVYYIKENVKHI